MDGQGEGPTIPPPAAEVRCPLSLVERRPALLASFGAAAVRTFHPSLLGATAVGGARPTAILWMAAAPPLMFGRRIAVGEQTEPKGARNGAHPPATEMGCPPSFGGTKTARMSSVGVAEARTSPPKCLGGAECGEARPTARLEDGGCAALVVWPSDRRTQGGSALTRWAGSACGQVRLEVPGLSGLENPSRGPGSPGRAADPGARRRGLAGRGRRRPAVRSSGASENAWVGPEIGGPLARRVEAFEAVSIVQ